MPNSISSIHFKISSIYIHAHSSHERQLYWEDFNIQHEVLLAYYYDNVQGRIYMVHEDIMYENSALRQVFSACKRFGMKFD